MPYFLFILVNAALFLRPAELFPGIADVPIYFYLIIACFLASVPRVVRQLTPPYLTAQPITLCVLGMLVAIVLSHLSHLFIWGARMDGYDFSKVVLYYLLLVGIIDSERRLKGFLRWLGVFIFCGASLALLADKGVIELETIESLSRREGVDESGEFIVIQQLRGTGIFNDPNDLSMILVTGIVIGLYFLTNSGMLGPLWLGPLAVMLYAFALTQSRGGFLALIAALGTLSYYRYGWKKTLALGIVGLPLLFAAFAGRMTNIDEGMSSGTGMQRLQLWAASFSVMKYVPLFGIGKGFLNEEIGKVAHNSFVQAFAELGLFGGTIFFGAFYAAVAIFYQLRKHPGAWSYPELNRMVPFLAAIVLGCAASQMSLSRTYVVPVYMVLGLAAVVGNLSAVRLRFPVLPFSTSFVVRLAPLGVCFLASLYIYTRLMVRW